MACLYFSLVLLIYLTLASFVAFFIEIAFIFVLFLFGVLFCFVSKLLGQLACVCPVFAFAK